MALGRIPISVIDTYKDTKRRTRKRPVDGKLLIGHSKRTIGKKDKHCRHGKISQGEQLSEYHSPKKRDQDTLNSDWTQTNKRLQPTIKKLAATAPGHIEAPC